MEWCSVCNGSGKVVAGYGVVCTEIVEKVEKCHVCKGKGFLEPNTSPGR
jgi:DnaJ-class molecular chaperone